MKKRIVIFLATAMAAICAQADTWTDPDTGYTWTYRIIDNTAKIDATITDSYYSPYEPCVSPTPWDSSVTIPSTLGGKPVTSIGTFAFYECSGLTSVTIPDSVTNIGSGAFYKCSGLTNITVGAGNANYSSSNGLLLSKDGTTLFRGIKGDVMIPDGVTSIGDEAFEYCSDLTSVTIPNSVTNIGFSAFSGCSGLTSVTIPDGVTSIGYRAFEDCSGLTSVTIPDGVTSIGDYAFSGCSGLTSVAIGNGVTNIGDYAFSRCSESLFDTVTIPGVRLVDGWAVGYTDALGGDLDLTGIRGIGGRAFDYCSGLTSVTIPDGVTSIGYEAFYGCSGLTSVTIPNGVTYIGDGAFRGCSGLTSVTIPDGVTSIGSSAFSDCSGLTSVTIGNGVTSIGQQAFYDCSGLTSVHITDLAAWCRISFFDGYANPLYYAHNLYLNGTLITDLTIPYGVTSIGQQAFYRCSGLTSVTIPDSVTSIGSSAFDGCSGLTSVTIGNGVTSIGQQAFYDCSGLTSVTIPDSVINIGYEAFGYCTGLRRVEAARGLKEMLEAPDVFAGSSQELEITYVSMAEIQEVTATQRDPWDGKVDITFEVSGEVTGGAAGRSVVLSVMATDRATDMTYVASADVLSGDTGTEEGKHHVVWDMNAQGVAFNLEDVVFTVAYVYEPFPYCVIDLAAGENAVNYPVTYLSAPPPGGFNTDEYKTTKLILRLIDPGSFKKEGKYDVTLTKPFYCGLFEVTQRQYELVAGNNPSLYKGDMRPVENLRWSDIRGYEYTYNWPSSVNVDPSTFMGRIRARTRLNLDLPTAAQWEYACRAGTTSGYNNGGDTEDDLKQLGRYNGNQFDGRGGYSQHTTVGSYLPNAWGLYDMHGNVYEWCLDWWTSSPSGGTDPVGPSSGTEGLRVVCGGSWYHGAYNCSLNRDGEDIWPPDDSVYGFRLARHLSTVLCVGESDVPRIYTVTLDANGGSLGTVSSAMLIEDGAAVGELPTPTRMGYTCDGWFTAADGGSPVSDDTIVTTNVTFYAHWTEAVVPPEPTPGDDAYTWRYRINGETAEIFCGYDADGECVPAISPLPTGAVTIPATLGGKPVTGIGIEAFRGCANLTSVTIPASITYIGDAAFAECDSLAGIYITDLAAWCRISFDDYPLSLAHRLYLNGSLLTDMTIPDGVTSIGKLTFAGCTNLTSVTIPDCVTNIGYMAFSGCGGLTSVRIGNGVTCIGGCAFEGCSGLTSVTIGNGVTSIDWCAFSDCSGLTRVTFKGNAPAIEYSVFEGVNSSCTVYVDKETTGWGVSIPGTWNGMRIMYVGSEEPVPEPTPSPVPEPEPTPSPEPTPEPTPAPVTPGYEVIEATDIVAPYEVPKAVTVQGVVYDGSDVVGIVELKLGKVNAKKHTGKVSGSLTTLDGKKHAIKALNLTEIDGTTSKAVSLEVKDFGTMEITIGGTRFAGSMGKHHVQSATVGGNWSKGGSKVYVVATSATLPVEVLEDLLPNGEPVTAVGGKWKFAKAAGVKWAKPKKGAALPERYDEASGKGLVVDTSGDKTNLSGMKLTYTPKKGTFKGSFKVYALEGAGKATKLKKYTVKVSGVVAGGVGYGTATCKKPAISWTVTVR